MLAFFEGLSDIQLILFLIIGTIALLSISFFIFKAYIRKHDKDIMERREVFSRELTEEEERREELAERKLKALAFNATLKRAIEASESGDINTAKYLMHELDRKYHSLINELVYENDEMTANDVRKFTMMRKYGVPYAFRIKDIKDNESKD
jgi:hypothetical protein